MWGLGYQELVIFVVLVAMLAVIGVVVWSLFTIARRLVANGRRGHAPLPPEDAAGRDRSG